MPLLFIPPWPSSFLVFYPYSSTKGPNPLTQFHGGPVIFRMTLLIITGAHHHCPSRSSPPHESPRHPLHRPLLSTLTFNPPRSSSRLLTITLPIHRPPTPTTSSPPPHLHLSSVRSPRLTPHTSLSRMIHAAHLHTPPFSTLLLTPTLLTPFFNLALPHPLSP